MSTPWLDVPLEDYEGHMSQPVVGQAQLIAQQLEDLVREYVPASVAVIGCAGGNGFERLVGSGVARVVGVDINAQYVETARERYAARLPGLELWLADIQSGEVLFDAVDLIYAALLFEHVDVGAAMRTLRRHCQRTGVLATLTQLPHEGLGHVSPSPYVSLKKLGSAMRLVANETLVSEARQAGFALSQAAKTVVTPEGKLFALHTFQASG